MNDDWKALMGNGDEKLPERQERVKGNAEALKGVQVAIIGNA